MANIHVAVEKPIEDGYKLKFRTPCESTTVEGLEVKYPAKKGVGTLIKKFVFKDAHGTELSGVGNLFVSGVMIEVLLDVTRGVAYIQNADTNSYVESVKGEIKRLEESQKQFLGVAGKVLEDCENAVVEKSEEYEQAIIDATERAESVKGVYVGSGDMPDGYGVQIDPNGAVLDMDTELNAESQNPVTNAAITSAISQLNNSVSDNATGIVALGETLNENKTALTELQSEVTGLDETMNDSFSNLANLYAPNGYGLGTNGIANTVYTLEQVNQLTKTGWYGLNRVNKTKAENLADFGVDFNYALIHVVAVTTKDFYQYLYVHPHNNSQCVHRRYKISSDTEWSPWEHSNPPMAVGVEYRTTERFLGKPVYTKLFSAPAGVSSFVAGIGENVVSSVVELRGMYVEAGVWQDWDINYIFSEKANLNYAPLLDKISLGGVTPSGASGYIFMKYTKA